jgi:hypothetical protein
LFTDFCLVLNQALYNSKNKNVIPIRNNTDVNHTTKVCNTSVTVSAGTVKSANILNALPTCLLVISFPESGFNNINIIDGFDKSNESINHAKSCVV